MHFAVIDTETNWIDEVMSIGVAIADGDTKKEVYSKYFIISPEFSIGGMFSDSLKKAPGEYTFVMSRDEAIVDIKKMLGDYSVDQIFAYNASFDYRHLPELSEYIWIDIMRIAAYEQYNKFIPQDAECCGTGRLKKGFGVESVLKMMIGNYKETHNAYIDAIDELKIVEILDLDIKIYRYGIINMTNKRKRALIREMRENCL